MCSLKSFIVFVVYCIYGFRPSCRKLKSKKIFSGHSHSCLPHACPLSFPPFPSAFRPPHWIIQRIWGSNFPTFTPLKSPTPMTHLNHPTSYETFTDFNDKPVKFLLTFLDLGDKYSVSDQEISEKSFLSIHYYTTTSPEILPPA
jgi:hypothetical protein